DPDNVAFCVLAADEEDEGDIALQIHFTLIQAFCCENDIDIVRVNDVAKLAGPSEESGEPRDLHCILITV
ncbi:Growth arrest and DNA damage-inducible protein GADD45 gamma, partial [Pterocles gutturalis]